MSVAARAPLARFDAVMRRVERKVVLNEDTEYSTIGVRWYGNGAFVRDRLLGADIARKQQWVLRSGDVVYNKLFAWKGAFAIADDAVDGHIVSDKFPTYEIDETVLDPDYFRFFLQTPALAFQAERLSKGAAAISKLTLNPPQFWDLTLPLPKLPDQRRIASRLAQARTGLDEAKSLRRASDAAGAALVSSLIAKRLSGFPVTGRVKDVLTGKPRNGWSAPCDNIDGGTPVLSLGAVTGFEYRSSEHKLTSEPTKADGHYWLRAGDLLMTRSNTEQLVGHVAIYDGVPAPCIYPDLMMRVPVDPQLADTRFVYYWLRTPNIRALVQRAGSGTSSTMKKITQGDVMDLPFPVATPVEEQRSVVAELDRILLTVAQMRSEQQRSRNDLDVLFPSLLDAAFHPTREQSRGGADGES